MVKIKICGLRRAEDTAYVNVHKPDYIGFVFAPSKRQVSVAQAAALREKLDKNILCVGVFVNETKETVCKTAHTVGLDVLQLHGDEDLSYIRALKQMTSRAVWKALRVKNKREILMAARLPVDKIILDSYSNTMYGGTGHTFDWSLLDQLDPDFLKQRVIISGGLNLNNVGLFLDHTKPYGIDVSSGVETGGYKDEEKISTFIKTAQGL